MRQTTTSSKRIRINRKTINAGNTVKQKLTKLTNEINNAQLAVEKLQKEIEDNKEKLYDLMESANIRKTTTKEAEAEIVVPKGRKTTTIPVREFKELVSEEEFLDTVTVPVTKAKKVITENELNKIAVVTPPAEKAPIVVVKPIV